MDDKHTLAQMVQIYAEVSLGSIRLGVATPRQVAKGLKQYHEYRFSVPGKHGRDNWRQGYDKFSDVVKTTSVEEIEAAICEALKS